jgi:hypothetical protein
VAAKNKAKARRTRAHPIPDIRQVFAVHLQASQRRDELLEEARALQAAGKIREARRAFKQAETVHQHIEALEQEVRGPRPTS